MPTAIRFIPSEPHDGFARITVLLGTDYVGVIAERWGGGYEFIPHRIGPFCASLRLPAGQHIGRNYPAVRKLVHGLLEGQVPPAQPPQYVIVRPDGTAWQRSFTSEAAAWGASVRGANNLAEWRVRKAEMIRNGWMVRPA